MPVGQTAKKPVQRRGRKLGALTTPQAREKVRRQRIVDAAEAVHEEMEGDAREAAESGVSEGNVARLLGFCNRQTIGAPVGADVRTVAQDTGGEGMSMEELGALLAVRGREQFEQGYRVASREMREQMERREQYVRREVLTGALLMVQVELEAVLKEWAAVNRPARTAAERAQAREELVRTRLVPFVAELAKLQRRIAEGEGSL